MKKYFAVYLIFILFCGFAAVAALAQENAAGEVSLPESSKNNEAQALREQIEKKSAELQALQAEREKIEKSLQDLGKSNVSLSRELKSIDYQINQLNLSIKANKITLEKLDLEIGSLNNDIKNIENDIQNAKASIVKLFVELQQKDKENILTLFLKNKSLASSVAEAKSITNLNNALARRVVEFRDLQYQLIDKLEEQKQKKKDREIEKINLLSRQYIVQDQKLEKQRLLAQTKNQEKIYQQELQDLIKRQLEISEEVEKIEKELRAKIDPSLLPIPRPGVFSWPVRGPVSQEYGYTTFAKNGYQGKFHNGVDIAALLGTPVSAAETGLVEVVGDQDRYCPRGAYGKYVVIKHDNNLTTLYAHLSRIIVAKGDRVEKGDIIGYVGRTGYATGPHLHFTVYASPTFYIGSSQTCGPMPYGGDLNPLQYL